MNMLFFFICVNFLVLNIFCVCGVLGICKEIILVVFNSFFSDLICVELFNISLFLILKNCMCILRCFVRMLSCVLI